MEIFCEVMLFFFKFRRAFADCRQADYRIDFQAIEFLSLSGAMEIESVGAASYE